MHASNYCIWDIILVNMFFFKATRQGLRYRIKLLNITTALVHRTNNPINPIKTITKLMHRITGRINSDEQLFFVITT